MQNSITKKKKNKLSYAKWGYIFIAPFFIAYTIFSLYPLLTTFYYSFFEYKFILGIQQVGPNYVGLDNYIELFTNAQILKYSWNTLIIWIMGFIPQILVSLLLAVILTSPRLKLRGTKFFKTIMYMPNLVMASAFSMLFLTIFSPNGPIINLLMDMGILAEKFDFSDSVIATRSLIAGMNFLMWFGNTTILLMAGIMGIDQTVIEAATVDGASPWQTFRSVIMPLLKPIFIFVLITSLIGGVQMFDIPQILTQGKGNPNMTSKTLVMYLYNLISISKNYGLASAVSMFLFFITGTLSIVIFRTLDKSNEPRSNKKRGEADE